jgi:hypothetical protein
MISNICRFATTLAAEVRIFRPDYSSIFRRRFANGNTLDIDYENGEGLTAVGLDPSMQGLAIGYTFDL